MTLVKLNKANNSNLNPWLTDVLGSVFNESIHNAPYISRVPAVNIAENANEFHIELAAPGLKKDDFKITLDKNKLSVTVNRKNENPDDVKKFSKQEFSYNNFEKSFTLPDSVDFSKIDAKYEDGILVLTIAKKEEAKLVKREIAIK
jgi:HSP20 family protein